MLSFPNFSFKMILWVEITAFIFILQHLQQLEHVCLGEKVNDWRTLSDRMTRGCPELTFPSSASLLLFDPLFLFSFSFSSPSGLSWYCVTTRVPISCFNGIKGKSRRIYPKVNEWVAKGKAKLNAGPWDASHMDAHHQVDTQFHFALCIGEADL